MAPICEMRASARRLKGAKASENALITTLYRVRICYLLQQILPCASSQCRTMDTQQLGGSRGSCPNTLRAVFLGSTFLKVEGICLDALGFVEFTSKVNHKLFSHGVWVRTRVALRIPGVCPRSYTLTPAGVGFVGKRLSPGHPEGNGGQTPVSNVQLQGPDRGT